MGEFVERDNIARFLDLLKSEDDPTKREMLEMLLAEERRKLVWREMRPRIEEQK